MALQIRYQVMEKLVGFMAPVPMEEMALQSQLFSNLFGKRAAQRS